MSLGLFWKYIKRKVRPLWEVPDNIVKTPNLTELRATCQLFEKSYYDNVTSKFSKSNDGVAKIGVSINEVYTYRILKEKDLLASDDVKVKRDITYELINHFGIDYTKSFWDGYKSF